jgi:hypothetical protein
MRKSPALAVLLSLVPGLGHIYAGETAKGIILFVATGVAGVLMVIAAGLQHAFPLLVAVTVPLYFTVVGPALVIYSMADSYRAVAAANARGGAAFHAPSGGDGTAAGSTAVGRTPHAPESGWWMDIAEATVWGLVLAVVGLFLVLHAAFPGVVSSGLVWPLLILVIAVAVLVRASGRGF